VTHLSKISYQQSRHNSANDFLLFIPQDHHRKYLSTANEKDEFRLLRLISISFFLTLRLFAWILEESDENIEMGKDINADSSKEHNTIGFTLDGLWI